MAEALAILGLVSAIVQFVEFGAKMVERLDEFNSDVHEVPKTFQAIEVQLPLLIDTLHRTQQQASDGHISMRTATALKPLIDECCKEITALRIILDKTIPPKESSNWRRRLQALKSLAHDDDVERSVTKLESHIRMLAFHQSTSVTDELLKLRVSLQTHNTISHPSRKPVFMVPFNRDETFVGRKDILDKIDQKLSTSRRRAVLSGIGGVGKSQIAIQYCYKYKSEQPDSHVLWVHCGGVARFDQGYREIARKLKLPGMQKPETDIFNDVYEWLSDEDNGSWLLVLDNADDQEIFFGSARRPQSQNALQQQLGMLVQYLPRSANGSTLITTRDRRVGERFAEQDKPIVVLPLEIADATSMLRSRLPNHLDWIASEIGELLENLEYLPLAIAQAASYISEEGVTVKRYLELLRPGNADSKALLEQDYYDSRRHPDIQNSVFQTWKMSFDQIQRQTPRAAEILSLMSMLDKQSIPARLLQDKEEPAVAFDKALGTLKNFSLIQEEKAQQIYSIHRLVQLSTHWWLEQEKILTKWQDKALDVLSRHCPLSDDVEDWKAWELISPHITIVRGYYFPREKQKLQCADITFRLASYYVALGQYEVALRMEEDALNIRQELLGQEHPDTLASMNNLAGVLRYQGKYEQAEEMCQQVLELSKTVQGKKHPNTLTSMNNLALVLRDQGKYKQAEETHRQELALCETVLGKEHPDTLMSINNLAAVLRYQGKYKHAEEILQRVLKLRETVLGKEHPDTLTSMNDLALVLRGQGKYKQAEGIHRQELALCETVLGKEHPSTLMSLNNLAVVLRDQGKYKQAEEMHRQVLGLRETILGKDHPSTLESINNLAGVLRYQGKYEQAKKMLQQALKLWETVLGKEHPDTLTSMNDLAVVLRDQSKYEQAEEIHRQVLRLQETVLNKEHPDTLMSMNNLAAVLRDQGNYEQAEEMHRQVLELQETVLGKEHPSTLTSMNDLVRVLRDQGKYEQAEKMNQETLGLREMVLGKDHPDTLRSIATLASIYSKQRRWHEAENLGVQVMEKRKFVLGHQHPDTLMAMADLARTWKSQGRDQEAIALMRQAERLQREILGIDHWQTMNSSEAVQSWLATDVDDNETN